MKIIEHTTTYASSTSSDITAFVLNDGHTYNLGQWNGEKWYDWWDDDNSENCGSEATPVYRFQDEGVDIFQYEEGSDEWDFYNEIVAIDLR